MRGSPFALDGGSALTPSTKMPFRSSIRNSFCVTADLLIPGKGDPFENGCIVVEGDQIIKVAKADEIAKEYSHLPKYHVKTLMPGMWDCHVHLIGLQKLDGQSILGSWQNMALSGARCAKDVMLILNAGFVVLYVSFWYSTDAL